MSHYDTFMSFHGTNDTYASKSIIGKLRCQYTMTRCEKSASKVLYKREEVERWKTL